MRTIILLHGYGVRSFFWEPIKTFFESKFAQVLVPDLNMENPTVLYDSTKQFILDIKKKYNTEIFVVGHSLGGVITVLLAQELGPEIIKKVGLIAVPYGEQKVPLKSFTKFMIKHKLIPNFLSRPRFFSKQTPKSVQKRLFKQVVPETEEMIDEILKDKYFHTDLIKGKLPQESIFFLSDFDKIVSSTQSRMLADLLGSKVITYTKDKNVAHDDYIASPKLSSDVSGKIIKFFLNQSWEE